MGGQFWSSSTVTGFGPATHPLSKE